SGADRQRYYFRFGRRRVHERYRARRADCEEARSRLDVREQRRCVRSAAAVRRDQGVRLWKRARQLRDQRVRERKDGVRERLVSDWLYARYRMTTFFRRNSP